MFYNARYYDPALGRFVSADTLVPGNASGGMDGVALKPLTVAFHEHGFATGLAAENQQPFWFQMSEQQQQQAGSPWGPANPQALNRYAYVQNNPLKWTDPSGHNVDCVQQNNCVVVHNDSSQPVYVTGDRKCDANSTACRPDGYETVTVLVEQGKKSTDYGIVDADFVGAVDPAHPIDGHGPDEVFHGVNGTEIHVKDKVVCKGGFLECLFGGGQRVTEQTIQVQGTSLELFLQGIQELRGKAGWDPAKGHERGRVIDSSP